MRALVPALVLAATAMACASVWAKPAGKPAIRTGDKAATAAGTVGASTGKQVFERWCAACHAPGPRYPGTASLAVKYGKEMPAALEQRSDLTTETVSYFVRNGVLVMPSFRKTEITDAELMALSAYLAKTKSK